MTIDVKKLALEAGIQKEMWMTNPPKFASYVGDESCLDRFAALVLEEAALKCDERAIDYAGLTEEQHASQRCAAIVRALKPTFPFECWIWPS